MAIKLFRYDPNWYFQAEIVIENLSRALGASATRFEHVGSTAVPGLAAKPKLHIDVTLANNASQYALAELLSEKGYTNLGDLHQAEELQLTRAAGPQFFQGFETSGKPLMAHRVCLCRHRSSAAASRRRFRDALRSNLQLAKEYEQLKQNLVARFGPASDWESYNSGKTEFINSTVNLNAPTRLGTENTAFE